MRVLLAELKNSLSNQEKKFDEVIARMREFEQHFSGHDLAFQLKERRKIMAPRRNGSPLRH